ncbi:hypothetical protein [Paenirhodobacter sp. CAU 1674]|uniref:hypothetical protein n=1 Tax=Paenirhodobacter sp. CAU 1674 TaxID=3032596 RepID=UPI0023DBBCAF|nr:hypothetical protein [Paenirhodobacter sp. CAU 1674]MDF2142926.1 hypothetical protein [Paenirhodobacter sp. CAU 1674]
MKRHISLPVVVLLSSTLCALAEGYAPDDSEGVWTGGYQQTSGNSIKLDLTQIGDLGQLNISFHAWSPVQGNARCQYVFRTQPGQPSKALINGSYGDAPECPADFSFTLLRAGANAMRMEFQGGGFLTKAEMQASLRPLRAADARAPVEGLDILGLTPGMLRADVERALDAEGYDLGREEIGGTRGVGWKAEALTAQRRNAPDDGRDRIGVQFTPAFDSEDTPQRLALVTRSWDIAPSENLSEITLRQALTEKYGQALNNGNEWLFDRRGQNLTTYKMRDTSCASNSLQTLPVRVAVPGWANDSFSVNLACGPVVTGRVSSDSRSGRAERLLLVLYDPDIAWDSFWKIWSRDEIRRIETLYDGVSSATGAAPKL